MPPQGHGRRVQVMVLLLLSVAALGVWGLLRSVSDPIVQGKRLSEHLNTVHPVWAGFIPGKYGEANISITLEQESDQKVQAAIREAGTNAIPLLIKMLHSEAPVGSQTLHKWLTKLAAYSPRLQLCLGAKSPVQRAYERQLRAVFALEQLGSAARPILPEILPLLSDPDRADATVLAIWMIRPDREDQIHQLTNRLKITKSPRHSSYLLSLESSKLMTIRILGEFRQKALGAAPILISMLASTNEEFRGTVACALGKMGASPEIVVPYLTNLLGTIDSNSHSAISANFMIIAALGEYGAASANAVPMLEGIERRRGPDSGRVWDVLCQIYEAVHPRESSADEKRSASSPVLD